MVIIVSQQSTFRRYAAKVLSPYFCCFRCVVTPLAGVINYTVSHNYGNPYEKWNIFVARPHLWLQLGMVKPEIILCEMVLNLSMHVKYFYLLTYLL